MRNRNDTWVDNTRTVFTGSLDKSQSARITVLGIDGESLSVHDRLMGTGFDLSKGQLVLSGVPFKQYDVICYLGGAAGLTAPVTSLVPRPAAVADEDNANKKKKKTKASETNARRVISEWKTGDFSGWGKHHRWSGFLSELSEENPTGNVVIMRGLSGPDVTITLQGSLLNGFQIVERH